MIKLVFRLISIVLVVVFLTVGMAIWKGGEPFRVLGVGTVVIGKAISDFGDSLDEFISGGRELRKSYDKFKDIKDSEDE